MIVVDLRMDISRIKEHVDGMREEISRRATVRALNRAGVTMQNEGAREVRKQQYSTLRIRQMKGYFRLEQASNRKLTVTIRPKGGRLPLTFFKVRKTGSGVTVNLGKERIRIQHAFVRGRGQRTAVFLRAEDFHGSLYHKKSFRRKRVNKRGNDLPIAELFARSIPEVILRKKIDVTVVKIGERRFVEEFERQLKFYSDSLAQRLQTGNTIFWKKT